MRTLTFGVLSPFRLPVLDLSNHFLTLVASQLTFDKKEYVPRLIFYLK